ncbi:hypothetical protein SAMN04244548_05359 [Paracoccus pantotrophus]|nr:hypothetical protein SAMN04244548_05359 [Paracoccus pantotrophus]
MQFKIGKVVRISTSDEKYLQYDMAWLPGGDEVVDSHCQLKLGRPGDIMVFGTRLMRVPFIYNATTGEYLPTPSSGYNAGIMAILGLFWLGIGNLTIAGLFWLAAIGLFCRHKLMGKRDVQQRLDEIAAVKAPHLDAIEASKRRRAELLVS